MKKHKKNQKKNAAHFIIPKRDITVIVLFLFLMALLLLSYRVWVSNQPKFYPVAMEPNEMAHITPPTTIPVEPDIITHGSRLKKEIALTFDADMTEGMKYEYETGRVKSWYDPRIVATLEKTRTKATFFLTGMWIELYPKITQQFALNPLFELENHSYDHPSFDGYCYGLRQIQDVAAVNEIQKTQQLLASVANVNAKYFRFPGGCYSINDIKIVHNLGLQVVHWDIISGDAFNSNMQQIEDNVINLAQNGSIIIFHLNGPPNAPKTAEALPAIIDLLKKQGYSFVKISELLK